LRVYHTGSYDKQNKYWQNASCTWPHPVHR
jgi:hypothetical protein